MKHSKLLFVSGTARSGTTLLSLVLASHPDICICPETNHLIKALQFYNCSMIEGKNLGLLKKETFNDLKLKNLKIDISEYYQIVENYNSIRPRDYIYDFLIYYRDHIKPDAKIIGQKKNYILYYMKLFKVFPDSKLICMFRDCRSSVPSAAKNLPGQSIISASRQWSKRSKLSEILADKYSDNYLELQYEKFVTYPVQFTNDICSFLNVNYDENMLQFHQVNRNYELISKGQEKKHIRTKEPVNTKRIHAWKENLSFKENFIIKLFCWKQMRKKGYY